MRQIALPDPVYAQIVRAAEAKGQSVEEYVVKAIERRSDREKDTTDSAATEVET